MKLYAYLQFVKIKKPKFQKLIQGLGFHSSSLLLIFNQQSRYSDPLLKHPFYLLDTSRRQLNVHLKLKFSQQNHRSYLMSVPSIAILKREAKQIENLLPESFCQQWRNVKENVSLLLLSTSRPIERRDGWIYGRQRVFIAILVHRQLKRFMQNNECHRRHMRTSATRKGSSAAKSHECDSSVNQY